MQADSVKSELVSRKFASTHFLAFLCKQILTQPSHSLTTSAQVWYMRLLILDMIIIYAIANPKSDEIRNRVIEMHNSVTVKVGLRIDKNYEKLRHCNNRL